MIIRPNLILEFVADSPRYILGHHRIAPYPAEHQQDQNRQYPPANSRFFINHPCAFHRGSCTSSRCRRDTDRFYRSFSRLRSDWRQTAAPCRRAFSRAIRYPFLPRALNAASGSSPAALRVARRVLHAAPLHDAFFAPLSDDLRPAAALFSDAALAVRVFFRSSFCFCWYYTLFLLLLWNKRRAKALEVIPTLWK